MALTICADFMQTLDNKGLLHIKAKFDNYLSKNRRLTSTACRSDIRELFTFPTGDLLTCKTGDFPVCRSGDFPACRC